VEGKIEKPVSLFTYLVLVNEVRYVHSEDLKSDVTKLVYILPIKGSIEKEVSNKFKVDLKDLEFDDKNSFDSEDQENSSLKTVVGHSININQFVKSWRRTNK